MIRPLCQRSSNGGGTLLPVASSETDGDVAVDVLYRHVLGRARIHAREATLPATKKAQAAKPAAKVPAEEAVDDGVDAGVGELKPLGDRQGDVVEELQLGLVEGRVVVELEVDGVQREP